MTAQATTADLNYLAPEIASSLYRNGAVLTRRDANGSDGGDTGIVIDKRALPILDARTQPAGSTPTLAANGFEVEQRPLARPGLDFLDHEMVVDHYYDECAQIVRAATGASVVHAFDHNVRSASGKAGQKRISGGQQVQGPAHIVHGDYTLRSAPERLQQLARAPGRNDTFARRLAPGATLVDPALAAAAAAGDLRFAIINVWRNITEDPVATRPLALCDGRSVDPEDLVVFEIHYADRIGENYFAKHAPGHRWFTYPGLLREEALLIKQWDSAGALATSKGAQGDASADGPCTFSFHTAFKDPGAPADAPDRWSIEVRCVALYA
ncbi:MAG TPA: CmcJ/NvfI family oxidoreductase [Pseudomonadales bacterium]|nr:CmcJ/NvfI family oxidoreductase [Pseudomonadales bacterium]